MLTPSRREFLKSAGSGLGYLAMAGLASNAAAASPVHGETKGPHFKPRARRVIRLFMQGGPSHVDTFDYKPELIKANGKAGGIAKKGFGAVRKNDKLLAPLWKFAQHGQSGLWISELFPHLAELADDLCLLNGMHTDVAAHPQATIMAHTGSVTFVRPSVGAWVLYGLGVDNEDLPGFVTINPLNRLGGAQNYGSAFLPAEFQATKITNNRIDNLENRHLTNAQQRRQLDLVREMNQDLAARAGGDDGVEGVISSLELAFRMQDSVPEVLDIASESEATRQLYGIGRGMPTNNFGTQCLMARKLAEAGVRYIELTHGGWDQHNNLRQRLATNARATDKPIAALIFDLKRRGLLEDTLIVWGGEFGRTPVQQTAKGDGRRHNNRGFSMWMCGGGVRGGMRYGATDPLGFAAVEDKMHIHDLHATMLHLLGIDHERLTYRYSGRDFRLTDVHGVVAKDILL